MLVAAAEEPIVSAVSPASISRVASLVQPENAPSAMVATFSGMVIARRAVLPLNANAPIVVSFAGAGKLANLPA